MSLRTKLEGHYAKILKQLLVAYYKKSTGDKKFCVFSNDCWGAEIYKLLKRPFNTPFIGLMLMGPCYIKLLENPEFYLGLPLNFRVKSKYPNMQAINSGTNFPLAVLGDTEIEIQFLHYTSQQEAKEKWERRMKRIDWNNLYFKYDCSKDYASEELVERFIKLPHKNKLLFGKQNFGCKEVIVIKDSPYNAIKQFKNCFLIFNPVGWISGKTFYRNRLERYVGKLTFKYI